MTNITREIPLGKSGKVAIVDASDYDWLSQYYWHQDGNGYVMRGAQYKTRKMHRLILKAKPGEQVDHRNHDKLDNTRSNIRRATALENSRNQRKTAIPTSSTYKGVHYSKRDQVWMARIAVNSKKRHLGTYRNEEDAARAYDQAAIELFGEFAWLNFPLVTEIDNG